MEDSPAEVIRHKFAQRLRHEIAIRNWNQSDLSRDGGILPATDVRDAGEGFAFIRINRRVPWPVAVKLLEILNDNLKAQLADNG